MTITYGLTPTGFVAKTTDVVRQQVNAGLIASYGASFDTSDASVAGELAGIFSAACGDVWGAVQGASASFDPDAAAGPALDALAAITGTFRTPAKSSVATVTLTGTPGTTVAPASLVAATSTGAQFSLTAVAILLTTAAWAGSTSYAAGPTGNPGAGSRVTNGGNVYLCIASGTSAASGGPTGTSSSITDGGVTWQWLGAGTGNIDATATSVNTGPVVGAAGDITTISTPVGGWSNVTNILDAALGANQQSDASLRGTRTAELASGGGWTADAILAALLKVSGVTAATVIVNNTDGYSIAGAPPHSVECIVTGGADQDVGEAIFEQVAAGIATIGIGTGLTIVTVVDSQGQNQTVMFTRPAQVNIYVSISLTYNAALYPTGGDLLVKEAIADWGNARGVGADAVAVALGAQAFTVPGVLDVPRSGSLGGTLIGTSPSPTSDATITIDQRHVAVYDTSRVSVTSTPGSP